MENEIPNMSYDERTDEEKIYYLKLAGKILYEVHEEIRPMVKPGTRIIDICTAAEKLIYEKNARMSFPVNVSINNIAAHYTSPKDDENVIPEGSIVKLDMGTHIDGFIADKAETYCFNEEYKDLREAVLEAWNAGMELIRPGNETSMVGVAVEDTIKKYNYLPIRELSGHQVERYRLHGAKSLPNVRMPFGKANSILEKDESYAFEVFATTGSGSIKSVKPKTYIYMLAPHKTPLRSRASKSIRNFMFREYSTLPFAERWLMDNPEFNPGRVRLTLNELVRNGGLYEYSVLAEQEKDAMIAQYENTFIVTEEGYYVTTMPPFDILKPESVKEREEKAEEQVEEPSKATEE